MDAHKLCGTGCGFFGIAASLNMCSKSLETDDSSNVAAKETGTTASWSSASAAAVTSGESDHTVAKKNRCFSCNKKVGLTAIKCKCGSVFCSIHRYPEKHSCEFDYKSAGKEAIAKLNPQVKADKIERF
ncbi:hypothetical protein MKX01_003300 [Papaver californicum]|nr:hypothetical protein MKX01_003300 [Papaver californicum]